MLLDAVSRFEMCIAFGIDEVVYFMLFLIKLEDTACDKEYHCGSA